MFLRQLLMKDTAGGHTSLILCFNYLYLNYDLNEY